ncbi:hypothetical protein D043_5163B, partial [Vibrio parahaemolyticus EKP-021]
YSLERLIIDVL